VTDYYLLSTYPAEGSGNVGDHLISDSAIELIRHVKGNVTFKVVFRGEDLAPYLEDVNQCRAVIMPGFAVRDPMYPRVYALTERLSDITVPLIPVGAGWSHFPGDYEACRSFAFTEATARFLRLIGDQVSLFACREWLTCQLLSRHGLTNTRMVGDCAWYHLPSIGMPMRRPTAIRQVAFTTPHRKLYQTQAISVLRMIVDLFREARVLCVLQSAPTAGDASIIREAQLLGCEVMYAGHDIDKLQAYEACDLHIGYRLHGHLAFLRKRTPSVLLCEDSRGLSASYTLGGGGFSAFQRAVSAHLLPNTIWSIRGVRTLLSAGVSPFREVLPDDGLPARLRQFLLEEAATDWRRYIGIGHVIDEAFCNDMVPFLRTIP